MNILVLFLIIFFNIGGCIIVNQFKKVSLDGVEWTVFISKTVTCPINGVIECGSACSAQLGNDCDLFVLHKNTNLCHVGYFSNTDTEYITDEDGPQGAYINVGK